MLVMIAHAPKRGFSEHIPGFKVWNKERLPVLQRERLFSVSTCETDLAD
jgi:hypothetical protein